MWFGFIHTAVCRGRYCVYSVSTWWMLAVDQTMVAASSGSRHAIIVLRFVTSSQKLWSNSLTRLLMYGLIVSHTTLQVHLRSYEINTHNRCVIVLIYLSQLANVFNDDWFQRSHFHVPSSPCLSDTAWEPDLMTNFDHVDHRLKLSEPCDLKIKRRAY